MAKTVKFGGSSLADANQFKKVKEIILSDPARRYVIPSAPGKRSSADIKVTDMLYAAYEAVEENGLDADEEFKPIAERFDVIIKDLELKLDLSDEYKKICENFKNKAGKDYAASRGEYLSGKILAAYLGFSFIDAANVIFFKEKCDNSSVSDFDGVMTSEFLSRKLATVNKAVIPGFYGAMPDGTIKTFSRGGSDFTGAIVAAAINADVYENWTDVDGFLASDPRIVENPAVIHEITYRELRELSYMGATVLHEDAVFPVRSAGISINIRNTNAPNQHGTLIVKDVAARKGVNNPQIITGIAGKKDFTIITIAKDGMNSEVGFVRKVLTVFEKFGLGIEHAPSGIDTLSIVLKTEDFNSVPNLTDAIKRITNADSIKAVNNIALLAVVGRNMKNSLGTAAKLFNTLAKDEINIRIIDQGSSEFNIIVGITNEDFEKATKSIYSAFFK